MDEQATRIVVFLSEDDRTGHRSVGDALVERAHQDGLAGATVWRAIEGIGRSGRIRAARFPDAGAGLPIAVEVIDSPDRIERFLDAVYELAPDALVTREQVQVMRSGN